MKSVKELSLESKILKRLANSPTCLKLANYLFEDEELQIMQEYSNNVSIKRLGYNDHGPVHMRQVAANAIKMLNILQQAGIKTSLEQEEIGTFEDSMCAVIISGFMHDLGMMIGRQGHEDMSVEASNGESIVHAHNVYLQVIHDHGLITGIVFTLFGIISFILLLVRFIKAKNDKMIYSLAIVIAFAVSGVAEWNFHLCNAFGLSVFMALTPLLFQDKEAKLNER